MNLSKEVSLKRVERLGGIAMPMKGFLRSFGAVALVVGVLSACASGEGDQQRKDLVGAGEICDGIFSKDAARDLRYITGADEFLPFDIGDGTQGTAKKVIDAHGSGGAASQKADFDLCLVYKPGSDLSDVEVSYSYATAEDVASRSEASYFVRYPLGRKALGHTEKAILYIECVSPELPGSDKDPVYLRGEARSRYEPDGDAEALRKAHLTILNSATLKLAQALGCEKNAGLSPRPDLTPQT